MIIEFLKLIGLVILWAAMMFGTMQWMFWLFDKDWRPELAVGVLFATSMPMLLITFSLPIMLGINFIKF